MRDGSVGSSPGWYPDPGGEHDLRYHNGLDWTGDVSDDGERHVAPLVVPLEPGTPDSAGGPTGTTALVLGILALCIAWIPFVSVVGAVLALTAIVVGLRRRRIPSARNASNAGIVTGAVGLGLAVIGTWLAVIVLGEVQRFDDPGPYETSDIACAETDGVTRATGTITNTDDARHSYTIEVAFDDRRSGIVEVDDVAAGSTVTFVVDEQLRFDEPRCRVVSVNGPLPFGLDIGL